MKPGPKNITEKQYIAAIRRHSGVQSLVAKQFSITRSAVSQRIGGSPRLQEVLREVEEENLDMAEGVIFTALRHKDKQTARWYAERKGKNRGYATKIEAEAKLPEGELEAIVTAFGGNLDALRKARAAADPSQAAKP